MSKSVVIWLSKSIFYVKNHQNLSYYNLKNSFVAIDIFYNINFQTTLIAKMMSNFWQVAANPIIKFW